MQLKVYKMSGYREGDPYDIYTDWTVGTLERRQEQARFQWFGAIVPIPAMWFSPVGDLL